MWVATSSRDDAAKPVSNGFPENQGRRSRQSLWNSRSEDKTFELKTATEDIRGCFRFNHIRHHHDYEALLCIGVAPGDIPMGAWSKADVTTGKAGKPVGIKKSGFPHLTN
ncbi:MAG: hypothetical protein V6Z86_02445 [Hyphomicrobiales bacterium]